ncbi:MAG: UDP-N-acetylmuramate--L-alanine ligase [Hyphomicrobiaceae bacterium]|nr:UDP-N-acetylmuramate--L-alanine ligase [Hyphomicrobiaceae bacterium]
MRMPAELGTFHIIGIGGIGMSAIAEILLAKGYSVQGSDQKDSANVRRLRSKGVRVFIGHDPINLVGARQVVISTAVKPGNPELEAARQKRLVIIRRAEMLAELMRLHATISITGTHGKTTTSSLVAQMFEAAGKDPTVITGGIINAWGSNARLGEGRWMIVEADESDGTFTRLPTEIGVVTNIDPEHLDYFGSVAAMHREYEAFMRNIPFYGLLVACTDHPVVRKMLDELDLRHDGRRLLTYGTRDDADCRLANVSQTGHVTTFDARLSARVAGSERAIERLELPMPGRHNALNALAAVAVAIEAGLDDDMIRNGLRGFSGVRRRFQPTGTWNGISFFDDYGHHPAEISAVLQAARAGAKGRVIAVVEPHRYTRVRDLFDEFSSCFKDADGVVVGPLYTAGEQPIEGIDNHALAEGIRATGQQGVLVIDSPTELIGIVRKHGRPGDMVICLGAGTSTEWAQALPGWLEDDHARMAGE